MNTPKKRSAWDELVGIEDALAEIILDATGEELRAEMVEAGDDPDACIAAVEDAIGAARAKFAREAIARARTELKQWRAKSGNIGQAEREKAHAKLERIRGIDRELDSKMMLAARKGEGLSDRDLEGMLDDLAELERLEREDGDE